MSSVISVPSVIHIGTSSYYEQGIHYVYNWLPNHDFFLCGKTTQSDRLGENLVIITSATPTGRWFAAVEGTLTDASFAARRPAFRTQAQFWTPGWHQWQVNRNADGGDPVWDNEYLLSAENKIPQDVGIVALNALLQLAPAD